MEGKLSERKLGERERERKRERKRERGQSIRSEND